MANQVRFGKLTVVEGASVFPSRGHAYIDNRMIRYQIGTDIVPSGPTPSKQDKINRFLQFAVMNSTHEVIDGRSLWNAIVEDAILLHSRVEDIPEGRRRALDRDGYTLKQVGGFLGANYEPLRIEIERKLSESADLPRIDDEVHRLLDELKFGTAKGHLDQAIENHSLGNWAAANSQVRSFIEGLFDTIAIRIDPEKAGELKTSENRREFLAQRGFLLEDLGEWGSSGKNFVNGLFKRLHGHGSHPGLSDEDDSTFRLHLALVTARVFLRRAKGMQ